MNSNTNFFFFLPSIFSFNTLEHVCFLRFVSCLFLSRIVIGWWNTKWLNYHTTNRTYMEWSETALGCRITRVRPWYVECDRFCNKFIVRCYGGPSCRLLLSSEYTISSVSIPWQHQCDDDKSNDKIFPSFFFSFLCLLVTIIGEEGSVS